MKPGESAFRHNDPTLVLKWCDKRAVIKLCDKSAVTVIYAILEAAVVITKKKHTGEFFITPEAIFFIHCSHEWGQFEWSISCIIFVLKKKGYEMMEKGLYPPVQYDLVEQLYTS